MKLNLGSLVDLAGNAAGLYSAYNQYQTGKRIQGNADPFARYRPAYGDQLMRLMSDPSAITNDPGYQFIRDQGLEGVTRKMAAGGYNGSGNMAMELTKYASGLASTYRGEELNRLATLAGAGIQPSPASTSIAAGDSAYDQLSGVLGSIGYKDGMKGVESLFGLFSGGGGAAAGAGGLSGLGALTIAPNATTALPSGLAALAGGGTAAGGAGAAGAGAAAGAGGGMGAGVAAAAPYAGAAAVLGMMAFGKGGIVDAFKKNPAGAGGSFDPNTGQVSFGLDGPGQTFMHGIDGAEEMVMQRLAPIIAEAGFGKDSEARLKQLAVKPLGYDKSVFNLKMASPAAKAKLAALTPEERADWTAYYLLTRKNSLWTGKNDIMHALKDAQAAQAAQGFGELANLAGRPYG